ncbi:PREDICTED: secretoglobin family 3A member 1 [Cercocebus atys]|uniref:secretoglobin family 3A member 1 n=1 Tax=Cercocebus atys TaxID=9531 RepID=UPI0005F38ADC|nr:PREDICTED: secretoglobin family 3A member 1 [Cercocebus atys]
MKLATALLGLCVALSCGSAAALFVGSAKHVAQPVTELESGAEAAAGTLAKPLGTTADPLGTLNAVGTLNPLGTLNLLKRLLASLGIPVNHLVEGSQKCVAELGPEAMGALKTLLGVLTMFGRAETGAATPENKTLPTRGG